MLTLLIWSYGCVALEKVHPYQGGYLRRKYRKDRRPTLPIESPFVFYPRFVLNTIYKNLKLAQEIARYYGFVIRLKRDPEARNYKDLALTPVAEDDFDTFEMFSATDSAKSAVMKVRGETQRAASKSGLVKIGQ